MLESHLKYPSKKPIFLLAIVLAGTLGLLLVMWWQLDVLGSSLDDLSEESHTQLGLVADILRLDEILTTSARMEVVTGDPQWHEKYELALPQLSAILTKLDRANADPLHDRTVQALRTANERLIALTQRALQYSKIGDRKQALDILDSPAYSAEHMHYHQELAELSKHLQRISHTNFSTAKERTRIAWQLSLFSMPLLFTATLILIFLLIRYMRSLRLSQQLQDSTRKELSILVDKAVAELNASKRELEREIEVRKDAEAEISASESRYRTLVEMSQAGFVILDDKGNVVDASKRYVSLTGYTSLDEVMGRNVLEWTAPEYREQIINARKQTLREGTLQGLEVDYMDPAGNITPVEIRSTRVRLGKQLRLYAIALDITERRKIEEAKRLNEERYQRLIETTETAFVVVDQLGIVRDANFKYVELTGHKLKREILGRSVVEWTADHEKENNSRAITLCFEQGWIRDYQVDYVMPDGSITPIEVNATRIEGGEGPEIHALCRDISQRRKTEAETKRSEQRLSIAFRGGQIGFWDWDIPTGDMTLNEEWAGIIGHTLEELEQTYSTWESRLHPSDKQQVIDGIEAHMAGEADMFEGEFRLRHKSGKWIWTLGVGRISESSESGMPLRMTGITIDISQRKEAEKALALSERRFRNVALTSGDWIWQVDTKGRYTYVSDTVTNILGYQAEDLLGTSPFELMPEDEAARVGQLFLEKLEKREDLIDLENWNLTKDGERICMLTNGVPFYDDNGDFAGYFGTDKDITERKKSEYQLKLFGRVFESALEGITITEADGTIIAVNQAFSQITGYSADEAIGQNPRILKSDRHDDKFYQSMWQAIRELDKWEGEIWNRRKNGSAYPEWLSISSIKDEDGHASHYVAVFHDITETKRKEAQIEHQAYHDALTGLPNRLLFHDRLDLAISRSQRSETMAAVLFLDLDNFKAVNDSLGHATGDRLLLEVADRFSNMVRGSDTVARIGGDEFVVLMDEISSSDDAVHLAERLIGSLETPIEIDGRDLFTTPSIGIALYPRDGNETETLIKNADIAMYRAKEQGRNQYNLFTASMNETIQRRLLLERDMRRALADKEFFLCYQPKVDTFTGKTIGMEALVRWNRHGEIIGPMEFIPIAEKTGLIQPLGELVLDTALSECADLLKCTDCLRLSVNISARQFQQPDMITMLKDMLDKHDVAPGCLDIELTESTLLSDVEDAILKLECLRRMGSTISVDDFGIGYSSLSYIKRLPVQTLKINRSFIVGLGKDQGDESIIRTIVHLARNFEMNVVAEGVETQEQFDISKELGCDQIQGYFFSRPVPILEFTEYLKNSLD